MAISSKLSALCFAAILVGIWTVESRPSSSEGEPQMDQYEEDTMASQGHLERACQALPSRYIKHCLRRQCVNVPQLHRRLCHNAQRSVGTFGETGESGEGHDERRISKRQAMEGEEMNGHHHHKRRICYDLPHHYQDPCMRDECGHIPKHHGYRRKCHDANRRPYENYGDENEE